MRVPMKQSCMIGLIPLAMVLGFCGCESGGGDGDGGGGGNTAPTAAFTAVPSTVETGAVVNFNANASSDEQDAASRLNVRWDWDGDGGWDTEWSTAKTASHTYATQGVRDVALQVKDTGNLTSTTSVRVTVIPEGSGNTPPVADFTVDPNTAERGAPFHFDAGDCTDAEDPVGQLNVRWDWESDGIWDTAYTKNKVATHSYASSGAKVVSLEVMDTGGLSSTASTTVTVGASAGTPPLAGFTVNPATAVAATPFSFDASGCSDAEDPAAALQVRWDWEADGTWDTAYTTVKTATHQYFTPGHKTIRMEVKDTAGLTSFVTHSVEVVENTAPQAAFTVDRTTGDTSTLFAVDASGCTDAEEPTSALKVRWDWDNNGTWDTPFSSTKTATHQYTTAGTKTIVLEVRDSGGLVGTTTRQVDVAANTPPTAAFTVTPAAGGTTDTVFTFNASVCEDAEDETADLQVRWDWESDGTWDTAYSTTKTATHQYTSAGTKTVTLQVRDTLGMADTETKSVSVTDTGNLDVTVQ